jgi:hypothetical protein
MAQYNPRSNNASVNTSGGRSSTSNRRQRNNDDRTTPSQQFSKYSAADNPTARANEAIQAGVDRKENYGQFFKTVGDATGIPFAGKLGQWGGETLSENLPEGPLKSTHAQIGPQAERNNNNQSGGGRSTGNQFLGGQYGVAPGTQNGQQTGQPVEGGQFSGVGGQLDERSQIGMSALQQQQALLGLGGQDAQSAAYASMNESPGQRFLRDRQEKALMRNQAADHGIGSGAMGTALQQQAMGFAQQDLNNQFGRLGSLSNQGYQAGNAGMDENYRYSQAAQNTDLMNQQRAAGNRENTAQILGMFSEPLGDIMGNVGNQVTDWLGWGDGS